MDGRHEYILSTVADRIGMTVDDAEEFMIDGYNVGTLHGVPKCSKHTFKERVSNIMLIGC